VPTTNPGHVEEIVVTNSFDVVAANTAPMADPNGPYTAVVNETVTFDGSGSTDDVGIVSYDWDFGDGSPAGTGVSPTHAYTAVGTYTVSLTVADGDGLTDTASTTAAIGAGNQPPVADPNGPYNGTVDNPVQFDGSGSTDNDGTIVSYEWDFGDGSPVGSGVSPTHAYTATGTYTVTLTVMDDSDLTDTATTSVTIRMVNRGDVEAKVTVPEAINPGNKGRTPVEIKIDFDGIGIGSEVAMINSVRCGPERLGPVAEPVRINREADDENEFVALFNTQDLKIERDDKRLECEGEGTLKGGTIFTFAGTSNEFKTTGRQSKDKDKDQDEDRGGGKDTHKRY